MKQSKYSRLRSLQIAKPCHENWDEMTGDDAKRFCAGCQKHVHNIAEIRAKEAEELLSAGGRVCTRVLCDEKNRIKTKDGWIPRLLLAGAIAATVAGCESTTGDASVTVGALPEIEKPSPKPKIDETMGKVATPTKDPTEYTGKPEIMGEVAVPKSTPRKKA
jgi:hypothetical protein